MRSSFEAFHDQTRPLRLLDDERPSGPRTRPAVTGAVLTVLAVVIPALVFVVL